jgi:hypothetical protein
MQFEITPEQKQLKEMAHRFAAEEIIPVAARCDEEQSFAEDVVRKAWELGLMNFAVPQELGGAGLGALDTCLVLEELNYGCAGITNCRRQRPRDPSPPHRGYRGAAPPLPRAARQRVLARSVLHHGARRGVRRRRHGDHLPAPRRRVRPERHQTFHFER